jgi:3-hydroxyisobutyrate dehydrogenase
MTERIGIVGTGRMGGNIALHLHDVGYPVVALYDINPESARTVAAQTGADMVDSLARVSELADLVLTVVSDDAAMRRLFSTTGDSLLKNAAGRIFVNCATIAPQVHVDVQKLAEEHGARSLEACMAASIPQARDGTLYLMVAGRREVFERVKPLLESMSASLRYMGEAGRAAQVKALVNMVMNINTAGLAEGLGLGEALGIDLDVLRDVFSHTGANSRALETDGADMQHREHDVYFSAAHAAKDSGIALELAGGVGLELPLARATFEQYERMTRLGLGELDKSGIAELTFTSRCARRSDFFSAPLRPIDS